MPAQKVVSNTLIATLIVSGLAACGYQDTPTPAVTSGASQATQVPTTPPTVAEPSTSATSKSTTTVPVTPATPTPTGASKSSQKMADKPATQKPNPDAAGSAGERQVQAGAYEIPTRGGVIYPASGNGPLAGKTIAIDPGHNSKRHAVLRSQVPAGNGKKKNCNTSGTQDPTGYAEHAMNWDVSVRLLAKLRKAGAKVVFTRPDNNGVGPCVNERAAIPNRHNADLLVSIHADGSKSASARGFHVIRSTTMVGGAGVQTSSKVAAEKMVQALGQGTGLPKSTYIGRGTGISPRSDIAGLNLLKVPGIMLEMGNVHHPKDGAFLRDPAGREKMAQAIYAGILAAQ